MTTSRLLAIYTLIVVPLFWIGLYFSQLTSTPFTVATSSTALTLAAILTLGGIIHIFGEK